MQRRLIAAGIRTISLPVDITNYLMLELGQPMHVFDLNRLRGGLVVRRATPGEKLTTLDGVARVLDAEDMVICDDTGPISLAAVMGGETSEWQPDTVDVLLEAAHWDPVMVGRTARRHKLFSEAAKRWERGVDPQLPLVALERAVRAADRARRRHGGRAGARHRPRGRRRRRSLLDPALPTRRIGAGVPADAGGRRCSPGSAARSRGVEPFEVTPPSWRPDLLAPADLVEEVARLGGYNDIPSVLPPAPRRWRAHRRRSAAAARWAGRWPRTGYVEVLSYPFVAPGGARRLRAARGRPAAQRGAADQPAVRGGAASCARRCWRRCSARSSATSAAACGTWRSTSRARCSCRDLVDAAAAGPGRGPPPVRRGVGGGERDRPGPAVAPRGGADRRARAGRLVGRGPRGRPGRTRSRRRGSRCRRRASRRTGSRYGRRSTRRGTRAGAPRSLVDGAVDRPRGRAAPGAWSPRSSCRSAPARWRSTWTRSRRRR